MRNFLYSVAEDLWGRYGEGVSELTIVLPNNRSRVFLVDALCAVAGRPGWGPSYTSVDQLMSTASGLGHVDRILAITELFKIYSQYHPNETFDNFYHWGEVLLGDFDAVDKYLVDGRMLFANVADLRAITQDLTDLTPEQVEAIRRFCATFTTEKAPTEHQRKFLSVWDTLWDIYTRYTATLSERGVGYAGMIYRRAAERIREGADGVLPEGRYVVVGFNALSASEKVLFDALQSRFEADFYWDYDSYYVDNRGQEAGLFVRENLHRYPAPPTFRHEDSFEQPKQMKVVAMASNSLQCKYAAEFIESVAGERKDRPVDKRTAIVLTDENLLSPLLYSLPNVVGKSEVKYNVTMGYPLKNTLAYSFVERLLQLQHRARAQKSGSVAFYHTDVEGLLQHPFVVAADMEGCGRVYRNIVKHGRIYVSTDHFAELHPAVQTIFTLHTDWHEVGAYIESVLTGVMQVDVQGEDKESRALRRECFGLIVEAVAKTAAALESCGLEMSFATYNALMRRVLQGVRIPYKGEPLSGVQVMGILETRNLDFDNVLLLSMNDDNFPSGRINDISFIPYNLRFGYGLPTSRESEGVYAYYFYRLVQRAKRVDMVYCSVADDRTSGEQSRYIYQLDYESPHELERVKKGLNVNLSPSDGLQVAKSPQVMQRLERFLVGGDKILSPSTFNNYLDCPLKFYFKAVAEIKPEEEIEEEIDNSLFGTIFHRAMETLYTPLKRLPNPQKRIAALIGSQEVHKAVVDAISSDYFAGERVPEADYGGNLIIVRDTIEKYINNCVLSYDATRTEPYQILELEYKMECPFCFDGQRSISFGGTSDRLDLVGGRVRIIDYKTGRPHSGYKAGERLQFAGIEPLFEREDSKGVGATTQTLIYSMMAERAQQSGALPDGNGAAPSLYYVRYMNNPDYSPLLNDRLAGDVLAYGDYAKDFEAALAKSLTTLFDPAVPFVATEDRARCEWCDFAGLCKRK